MRERQMKNFMVVLMVSTGLPLILMGDEIMSTRHGNNNYYGHDTNMTHFDWSKYEEHEEGFFRFYRFAQNPIPFEGVLDRFGFLTLWDSRH